MASIRETVLRLVDELRALDPRRRVFGAAKSGSSGHDYRFDDRLSIADVRAFEGKHGVALPADYREFVTEVGDGGAGPHYGIQPLAKASEFTDPSRPFPWTSKREMTAEDLAVWEWHPGVLILAERGCAYEDFLIVNGDAPSRMWSDFVAGDGSLVPCAESFASWYTAWATRCIATIRREPLIERVRVGMTADELRCILGSNVQRWEPSHDLRNAPAYYLGFTNTNASFSMGPDDRIIAINRMNQV